MSKFTKIETTKERIQTLEQKSEIDHKLVYYKEMLFAFENIIKSINERIKRGYETEKYRLFGIIPTVKTRILDSYEKAKLVMERYRAEYEMFEKKNYYEMWLERSKQYDKMFIELSKEADEQFDHVMHYAKEVSKYNIRLAQSMADFKNENNDQKLKVEYYLYLKQEVENAEKAGRIKRTMMPVAE
jgi:hypothetical protein